jgi:hypothetical protein
VGLVAGLLGVTAPAAGAHADPPRSVPTPAPPHGNARCVTGGVSFGIFSTGGPRIIAARQIPFCVSGAVTVAFHGSRSAGCAAHGLCGYRGTASWRLVGGQVLATESATHGARSWTTMPVFDSGAQRLQTVRRAGGKVRGRCTERGSANGIFGQETRVQRDRAEFVLPSGGVDVWRDRCAGPPSADLPRLVNPRVPFSQSLHGVARTSVSRTRHFAAGGWAGTVVERLTVSAGPSTRLPFGNGSHHHVPGKPERAVEAAFRVGPMTGSANVVWSHGRAGCTAFDACGLTGSEQLSADDRLTARGQLRLWAYGPAKRPQRDFLTALGVARGGDPKGISVTGIQSGENRLRVQATTRQPGARCTATTAAQFDSFAYGAGRLRVLLGAFGPPDPLRTSCPGPPLGEQAFTHLTITPGQLAGPHPSLTFDTPREFRSRGFHVAIDPDLTLPLTDRRISDHPGTALPFTRRSLVSGEPMMH